MGDAATIIGGIVMVLVLLAGIVALAFALELGGLKWNEYFGPKRADVERKTFEKTRSFNEAKKQELLKYRLEWVRAKDPMEKAAIESTVRHAFADYNEDELDPELRDFLWFVKYGEKPTR
jgi:hypothetical protein